VGRSREEFPVGTPRVNWWGRVEPEWIERRSEIQLVWAQPDGHVVQQDAAKGMRGAFLTSSLALGADAKAGIWQVTAQLDDEDVGSWTFRVVPGGPER